MEVDFTRKAKYIIRYGLVSLIAIAAITASVLCYVQYTTKTITLYNAEVKSTLVNVVPKANGTITELVVESGTHVEAGDVIARVSPSVSSEDIANLEQAANLAKKNLEELQRGQNITVPVPPSGGDGGSQQRIATAAARLQRMNELYDMGAISASKRDEAAAEYEAAKAAAVTIAASSYRTVVQPTDPTVLKNAQLQVKQAQTALEAAKKASIVTEIVAPISGTVYCEKLQVGTQVKADTPIATIGSDSDLHISVEIPSTQIGSIHLGQLASYTLDGKNLQGSVQEIEEETDEEDGIGTKFAVISIPEEEAKGISPGMATDVILSKNE